MKDENEPVADDELVIRAIWTGFFDAKVNMPVLPIAFLPRSDETDGISVFRAACVSNPEDVLVVFAEEKRDRYAIALLPVSELKKLELTVKPSKIDKVAGHAVIPELNIVDVKADKDKWRDVQKALAALANKNIVRPPKT